MSARSDRDVPWVIHQSDLQSWNYCPRRLYYERQGAREHQLSATAYGSVLHHAMHVLERYQDLDKAIETFLFYWHPLNIEAICPPVSSGGWIGKDSYGEMRKRGVTMLRRYADYLRVDDHELLGLETEFIVPVRGLEVLGRPVYLAGTMDRLAVRWYRQRETLCVDDFKTGQQKWGLRYNVQGSAYAYATWQPEFWTGMPEGFEGLRIGSGLATYEAAPGFGDRAEELNERFARVPRRFTWINLKSFKLVDGGYRGRQDYERMKEGIAEIIGSADRGIFPLRIDGETCRFCPFKKEPCGVPDENHGDPAYALEVIE